MSIDRKEIKALSREQIKGNVGILFLCSLIVGAISGLLGVIPAVGAIANFIITPVLYFGLTLNFIAVSRNGDAVVERTFDGFKNFGNVWVMSFLIGLFTFLWSLLLIIPGIIKGISYSFAPYILADNPEMSGSEAINVSKSMTYGHKGELFVLGLSFFWWYVLCIITFGLASIYVSPYICTAYANAYNKIKEQYYPENPVI